MPSIAPFPTDPVLTGVAIAYKNESYIADEVLPRISVSRREFEYSEYSIAESFARPDTKVGRRSEPNNADVTADKKASACEDFGLDSLVPNADIEAASEKFNPKAAAVARITNAILLDREKRVADMVFDAAHYGGNVKTLAGKDQFSDFDASNPVSVFLEAMDACMLTPNIIVMGRSVWSKLSQHPKIVKGVHGNAGDVGVAKKAAVADLLGVQEILVGEGRLNTAKPGQAATLERIWGNSVALIHRDKNADAGGGVTFGFTAQFGGKVAGEINEPRIGLKGSVRVRAGEVLKELIIAPKVGYLLKDVIA